ncbi:MAG TPA: hypothetical protein VGL86_28775 [Polyangia bacterium]
MASDAFALVPLRAGARGLVEECAEGLELFSKALAPLEQLGGGHELRPVCHQLMALVGTEVVVAVAGARRGAALSAALGIDLLVDEPAPGVTVWLRNAAELGYRASWADGSESSSADESAALRRALEQIEAAARAEAERAGGLDEALRAAMAAVAQTEAVVTTTPPTAEHAVIAVGPPAVVLARTRALLRAPESREPPLRSWVGAFFARLWAWIARLFGGAPVGGERTLAAGGGARARATTAGTAATAGTAPATTAPALTATATTTTAAATANASERADVSAAVRRRERKRMRDALTTALDVAEAREHELAASRARVETLAADRAEAQRRLEHHRSECERRILMRVRELSRSDAPVEVEVAAPYSPDGVVLLIAGAAHDPSTDAVDATVVVQGDAPYELIARVLQIRDQRPAEVGRRLATALCSCRNQIVDLDERGRQAHRARVGELTAQQLAAPARVRERELTAAQRPVAQQLERIVDEAASELERLVEEVRRGWQARIAACDGIELLRAEVGGIEDGAAHRLSLVCDELREKMTVQFVRLVLEQSRSLRQELLRKRHEVARGRSPKVEETFDDVRLVLPASLDQAFAALRAPDLGELLANERSLFDPLFRTVAREKRQCQSRLDARLDDIERTTARELYASTASLSPLLLSTLGGLLDELLRVHASWIQERIDDEARADGERAAILAPALALVEPLAASESRLVALVESVSAGASRPRSPTTPGR